MPSHLSPSTQISSGSALLHGSAEQGGFALSVTEFASGAGIAVYQVQQPGGSIFLKRDNGYEQLKFVGVPSDFKKQVETATDQTVDLWVSDEPMDQLDRVSILRDESGNPVVAISHRGNSFSISALNVNTPFRSVAKIKPQSSNSKEITVSTTDGEIKITMGEELKDVTFALKPRENQSAQLKLDAADRDNVRKYCEDDCARKRVSFTAGRQTE
jgi:hypothetical protein